PVVTQVLADLERDVMRTGRQIQQIYRARYYTNGSALRAAWKIVPPPGGSPQDRWHPIEGSAPMHAPRDAVHSGLHGARSVETADPELAERIAAAWTELQRAWRFQDAPLANQALDSLATEVAGVDPASYPSLTRRSWELRYHEHHKLTGTWVVYFFAIPFLLMSVVYRFRWARLAGFALFGIGFGLHSAAIVLRWYLAGRIPNANMFEAVLASAWLGCVVAIALEIALKHRPVQYLPALTASVYGMTAMMAGRFMPVSLNSDITTVMPVLDRTIWLYIHTNIVIASYALIFFAGCTALLYLAGRAGRILPRATQKAAPPLAARSGGWEAATDSARQIRRRAPGYSTGTRHDRIGLGGALDGATMIFMQLGFVTLWIGTILGAVWADVSWGRPWGWDPKEVFALNTWLVLLLLVHTRVTVRDKALWTAVLALISCAVMLFNWIAVNFVIVGLHSYA
ncbi:MAG: cytochrome c biogenesis protein CcsA, partial [Acidobacteriota bacterium]